MSSVKNNAPLPQMATSLAQGLFGLPSSTPEGRPLPPELQEMVFDHMDRSTLLKLRCVSKDVNNTVMNLGRKEFNTKRANLGHRHTIKEMIQRQDEARRAAESGEVIRKSFQIDCDPSANKQKTFFDRVAGEYLFWTRTGQLVAVGPYDEEPMREVFPAGTLTSYGRKNQVDSTHSNEQAAETAELLYGSLHPTNGTRHILTYDRTSGLALWTSEEDGTVHRCALLFQPPLPYGTSPAQNGHLLVSEDGSAVLYEDSKRTMAWRWQRDASTQSTATSVHTTFIDNKHQIRPMDGLVLPSDSQGLILADPATHTETRYSADDHVSRILPFSPCGGFAATVNRTLRYKGQNIFQIVVWTYFYEVKRTATGLPTLNFLTKSELDSSSFSTSPWTFTQQEGWSATFCGDKQRGEQGAAAWSPQRGNSYTDEMQTLWRFPELLSLSKDRTLFAHKNELGSDINGASYKIVCTRSAMTEKNYLIRTAFDGVSAHMSLRENIAKYLVPQSYSVLPSLWSQDGTAILRGQAGLKEKVGFELIQFKRTLPTETRWSKAKRSAIATATDLSQAVRKGSSALRFLLPNFYAAYFGLWITLGMALLLPPCSYLLAVVFGLGILFSGFLISAIISSLLHYYTGPRPWKSIEILSA